MDIFFQDPNDVPLPPEEVRLREVRGEPWPDGRRVKVSLELTPFQKRPSAEIILAAPDGSEAAHASILEAFTRKMELNLHLPQTRPPGEYTLSVTLYYQKLPTQEQPEAPLPPPLIVDRSQVLIQIPE